MSKVKTSIPVSTGQRSHADLSAVSIGTTDFGRLDVLYHTPVNPGEDVKLNIKGVLQSAPMVVNTFGEFRYDVRAFFVPYRILTHRPEEGRGNFVWDYFINNLSQVSQPSVNYRDISFLNSSASNFNSNYEHQDYKRLISQLRYPKWLVNLTSYLPDSSPIGNKRVNIWAPMSYQRIWWDFYRNSQLIDESLLSTYIPYPTAPLGSTTLKAYYQPRYACFDKDYFTNCIPTANLEAAGTPAAQSLTVASEQDFDFHTATDNYIVDSASSSIYNGFGHTSDGTMHVPAKFIRAALAYDNYLSKMQIVGTRIRDRVRARFGLSQSSESVNTSQYLGGTSARFTCGKMMNIADTYALDASGEPTPNNAFFLHDQDSGTPSGARIGNIDEGFGTGDINFHVKEYGTIMILGTLIPKTGYYQGMNKDLTLGTASTVQEQREEYLTPELANTGLVPIRQSEIFGTSTYDASDNVFGWTQKYGSYTWQPSVVDGDMILSDTNTGMSSFHTFREFSSAPSLSNAFTMITPSERVLFDRIFQVQTAVQGESTFDHFNRFTRVQCDITRAIPASWLPELYEDNNHGNTIKVDIGGSRVN